ncbi:hypothetical protein [Bifidobacterium indicum]|uniref:hypothetical protein n=1 Tax=Bifidobacterium indicum TaxID=1691 RepID=UPI0030DB8C1D
MTAKIILLAVAVISAGVFTLAAECAFNADRFGVSVVLGITAGLSMISAASMFAVIAIEVFS